MGLLAKIFTGNTAATAGDKAMARRAAAGEYIPAGEAGVATRGGISALAERATQVYRNNPKLVGTIAMVAAAMLLNSLKRPRP